MKRILIFVLCLWAIVLVSYAKQVQNEKRHGKAPTPVTFATEGCSSSSSSGGAE